jgi:glutaconyl-CoA/methylmalonyl-CoA decarboxylase subunit gamma
MKQLRVTVHGKTYEVTVELLDSTGKPAEQVPGSVRAASALSVTAAPSSGDPGAVQSPLAGKIISIQVTPGQEVKQGEQVVVLEAMKMNTYIYAPKDGKVAEILVKVGDAVAEGQVLMSIA